MIKRAMSNLIKFDFKELKQLANDKHSCIVEKTVTQNLTIEPWCLGNLKESIKNLLDYKIGKFVKELNGILISFKNLRILQNVGSIKNNDANVNFQVQADYFIFQPYVGATLKGLVYKKNITHLRVLLHRVFNVVIPRPADDNGNTWIGSNIQENQEVVFKVAVLDLYGALPYIRGELDERWTNIRYGSVDEATEQSRIKTIEDTNQQPRGDKPVPTVKNYNDSKKYSVKTNVVDNNSISHRQAFGENEINLFTKSKNKRYKN